jgi:hypothetical protein
VSAADLKVLVLLNVRLLQFGFFWGREMKSTIQESFDLFTNMRNRGIVAHVWP